MSPWKSALLHLYYFGTSPYRSWYKTSAAAEGTLPAMILFYHRIADDRADSCTTSNDSFARQIAWLQRNVELISLAEVQRRIGSAGNSRPCASITFDDGYAENCRQAIPLLIREKIPCTYFVTLQNILTGEPFPHDRAAGRHFPPNKLDELRAMANAGIEIGSHSYTHPDLSQISDPAILYREVVVAGEELRDRLQCPIRCFAVPYGQPRQLKPVVFDLARQAGYEAVCSAYGGYNYPGDDPFHLRRIHGDGDLILLKNRATLDPRKLRARGCRQNVPSLPPGDGRGEGTHQAPGSSVVARDPVGNALRGVPEASDEAFCLPRNATEGVPYSGVLLTKLRPGAPGPLPKAKAATFRTDTLADSVLILLLLMVVQRLIGFCRAVLFCRWLDPGELGQWDITFGFLMLAGPLSVMTLSSSLGRYVQFFTERRQLRTLLKRTAAACGILGICSLGLMALFPGWFARLIYGEPERTRQVWLVAGVLATVIVFNYFVDLCTALRNVRLIAGLQLFNSIAFAVLGVGLLLGWRCSAAGVILAYGGACLLSSGLGVGWLLRSWHALPRDDAPPTHFQLWSKLLPFTASVWATSLLANLFDITDRYMILHFSPGTPAESLAQVGCYHSSRLVPLLLVSVAQLLTPMITPHLSEDWEQGRRERVSQRLKVLLKLAGLAMCMGSAVVLFAAPLLFGLALKGKFAGGLAVLPLTLTYCTWFGISSLAQNYLWCAEKARLGSIAFLVGLVLNVGLNLLLLPRLGLPGAALATAAANLVVLAIILGMSCRLGFRLDAGICTILAIPLVFWLGPWVTLTVLTAIGLQTCLTDRIFSRDEKQQLLAGFFDYGRRLALVLRPTGDS
jgi:O-antigen/teichoic acid export membrane protein/peptidoglycan/xylan/chitin deacetylase (PgdA/CDA1 family)